jgi:hypothetical protein
MTLQRRDPGKMQDKTFENSKGIYAREKNIIGENNLLFLSFYFFILNDIIGDIIYT